MMKRTEGLFVISKLSLRVKVNQRQAMIGWACKVAPELAYDKTYPPDNLVITII